MENYEGSESGPPFSGHYCHDVAVTHLKRGRNRGSKGAAMPLNSYFVYSSANAEAPSGQVGKFYDMGNFQIAANGCQAATPAGELWVEHEWTMIRRKQSTPLGQNLSMAHIVEGAAITSAAATLLGTTGGVLRSGSNFVTTLTTTSFTMQAVGFYLVVVTATTTGNNITAAIVVTPGSAITAQALLNDNGSSTRSTFSTSIATYVAIVSVATPGSGAANTMTLSGATGLNTGSCDVLISQLSSGITLKPVITMDMRLGILERFVKMMSIREEPDSDFEEKTVASSSSSSSSSDLSRSLHLSRDAVRQLLSSK